MKYLKKYWQLVLTALVICLASMASICRSQDFGTVQLAPTIVNISNWTHGSINEAALQTGWGMPIPQQLSITREDQAIKGLLHTNTWDYGFNQSYTFNQVGAQTTFEVGKNPTFGMSSAGAITRPLDVNPWPNTPPLPIK